MKIQNILRDQLGYQVNYKICLPHREFYWQLKCELKKVSWQFQSESNYQLRKQLLQQLCSQSKELIK